MDASALVHDLPALLSGSAPLIDVRAPAEFARGAFPNAINLPLLSDLERDAIGKRYRAKGQQSAIELGEQLVSGSVRDQRIAVWRDQARRRADSVLYCWRGGLRSEVAQAWLADGGIELRRVPGGYKAMRRVCLSAIEACALQQPLIVLAGRTGSGKTDLLNTVGASIDLEGIARHRGSAFGATAEPQPTPIGFENALAVGILRLRGADCPANEQRDRSPPIVLEDESRTIGRLALPESLHAAMQRAPLVVLEAELDARSAHIWQEYVAAPLALGLDPGILAQRYLDATDRIQRRLGGLRHRQVRDRLAAAFQTDNDPLAHQHWIEALLEWYYDPMYDYQLSAKQGRIVFSGTRADVRGYLVERALD